MINEFNIMNQNDKLMSENNAESLLGTQNAIVETNQEAGDLKFNKLSNADCPQGPGKTSEANTDIEKQSKLDVKTCLFIELNENISYFNMSTFFLVQFTYVSAFTFIDACQDNLLESDIYNIDKDKVGTINGDILLYDTLYLIAFIYIYGAFHDVFGRKLMIVYGFLSMALSLFLYPLAGNVYPNLILVR